MQTEIVRRSPEKREWWVGAASSGPFIYTPFTKGSDGTSGNKEEVIWVVGEPVQVIVEIANPCAFEVFVQSIYLSVDAVDFEAYPAVGILPSNSSQFLSLSGIPLEEGPVSLRGCIVHCFDVITEHKFEDINELLSDAAKGLSLTDPFRSAGGLRSRHTSIPDIVVMPSLPLLTAQIVGGQGAAVLYEGELREVQISLGNASTVPIVEAHLSLTGKQQDHVVSMGQNVLQEALPLLPGATVVVPVTLKAGQLSTNAEENNPQENARRSVTVTTSAVLVIHYAGKFQVSLSILKHS